MCVALPSSILTKIAVFGETWKNMSGTSSISLLFFTFLYSAAYRGQSKMHEEGEEGGLVLVLHNFESIC